MLVLWKENFEATKIVLVGVVLGFKFLCTLTCRLYPGGCAGRAAENTVGFPLQSSW